MNEIVGSMLMPFGVAVGGAILGLLIAWRFLKLEESASITPLVDLDERVEHLIALLKDGTAGDRNDIFAFEFFPGRHQG